MYFQHHRIIVLFCAMLAWTFSTGVSSAAVIGVSASNVDAYFGSLSDGYQDSNPVGLNPWAPIGPGPYLGTFLPPGVPAIPAGNVAPSNVTPFAPTPSISSFSDVPGNVANSKILGFAAPTVGIIDDAQIAMGMYLNQIGTTYAYEQLNYSIDFALANTLNSAGTFTGAMGSMVTRSYFVSGNVGSYVNFGGEMNFWDVPTVGLPIFLGQLTFSYNNFAPGPFSSVVTGSGIIGGGWVVNNPDVLRITGDFFVAGDPSTISVQTVPEPSTLSLLGIAGLGLLAWIRRRS